MTAAATLLRKLCKAGAIAFVINEIRGLILAVPVLLGLYRAGGDTMAIWIGVCSLAGIALSVAVPLLAIQRLERAAQGLSR